MLRNRVFYIMLVLLMTGVYLFTNTWYTLTMLLLCFVLPLLSLGLMLLSRRGLVIRLRVPGTAHKDEAVLTYELENTVFFPVARVSFRVRAENQMTGRRRIRKVNATVPGRTTVKAELSFIKSTVGTVIFETEKIRVFDAFGLFAVPKASLPAQSCVVYPQMRPVHVYMERPVETTGEGSRYAPERPGWDVSEIFAMREYVPGDEVRKIHWKLSSKLDKMMVRDFSLPLSYSVFLLMELTAGTERIIDAVAELYLSMSRALLENGINHNLAWYDGGGGIFHVRELNDFENLDMASAEVLASYVSEQKGIALEYYMAGGFENQKNILVYITSSPDSGKLAEAAVSQVIKTIYVYEDEQEKEREMAAAVTDMIAVSVAEAAEGIPEIMV